MNFDFNSIIGMAGTAFGLIGIIFSIYSYIKSKKTKKAIINSESSVLISETLSKYENLKIFYNDESIRSLTSTTIKIRNIGTDIIEPSDLMPSSPITIKTSQKFLLKDISQYKIISSNTKNIVSLYQIDDVTLQVKFDFLNPKDEITITILHTGEITVDGDLKTNPIKNYTKKKYDDEADNLYHKSESDLFKLIEMLILLILMMIISLMAMSEFMFSPHDISSSNSFNLYIIIIMFIYVIISKNKK